MLPSFGILRDEDDRGYLFHLSRRDFSELAQDLESAALRAAIFGHSTQVQLSSHNKAISLRNVVWVGDWIKRQPITKRQSTPARQDAVSEFFGLSPQSLAETPKMAMRFLLISHSCVHNADVVPRRRRRMDRSGESLQVSGEPVDNGLACCWESATISIAFKH